MNIYWFQRQDKFDFKSLSEVLEKSGFTGILFAWSSFGEDYFTHIANKIDPQTKIKYMVAIRPYTVSPQYLSRTYRSMNNISENRILVNFVSGWVYDEEKKVGGILNSVNDMSSSIDRSSYLIEYIKTLNEVKKILPDFYISVTNEFVFNASANNKCIIPYSWYKINKFNLEPTRSMIHISPIIRESQEEIDSIDKSGWPQDIEFFTKSQFKEFFYGLERKNFDGILISNNLSQHETNNIINIIKEITEESMR